MCVYVWCLVMSFADVHQVFISIVLTTCRDSQGL